MIIEQILVERLNRVLGVSVVAEESSPIVPREVVLEKIGSSRENFITTSMISAKSYAESLHEAAQLNEEVKEAMFDSVVLDEVSGCSLNSEYNNTDTVRKRYCYRSVFNITHF